MWRHAALLGALVVAASAGNLTVGGGTAQIPEGTVIEIVAAPAPTGMIFDRWVGDTAGIADVFLPSTTLTMPAGSVSIQATYIEDPDIPPPPPPPPAFSVPDPGVSLTCVAETDPTGGDADDPAIALHPTDLEKSLILGTDKAANLIGVCDLHGKLIRTVSQSGQPNNIDVRYDFPYGDGTITLAATSLGVEEAFVLHRLDFDGQTLVPIAKITDSGMPSVARGLGMYRSPVTGKFYVFINCKNQTNNNLRQYEISSFGTTVTGTLVRTLTTLKAEGVVADDETGNLFVAEEDGAAWVYGAEPDAGSGRMELPESETWGGDMEGICLYHGAGGTGYVILSAQGWGRFAVYDRRVPFTYRGSFRFQSGNGVDGVTGTDGVEVIGLDLGPSYPYGLFVCQDESPAPNNFKIARWDTVANSVLGLIKDTRYDPR
jgi:3-phytase